MYDENAKYQELFFQETEDYLDILNNEVLKLEKDPKNKDTLNTIFRAAHTLKGMAGTMGYDSMTRLSHSMEDVFEIFRSSDLNIRRENINLIFESIDMLSEILGDIRRGNSGELDVDDLLSRLDSIVGKEKKTSYTKEESIVEKKSIDDSLNIFDIDIRIEEDCQLKGARAFLILNKLKLIGNIISTDPDIRKLEEGDYNRDIKIELESENSDGEVLDILNKISDIEEINIDRKTRKHQERENIDKSKSEYGSVREQSVKISLEQLDDIMNMLSELVIHRIAMEDIVEKNGYSEVIEHLMYFSGVTSDLQNIILDVRMQPISLVFNRFPRMIRDLSVDLDKDVDFIIEGEDTELDRTIISELSKPLVHLLRNSMDHGIEPREIRLAKGKSEKGTIKLKAKQSGDRVIIFVEDDGKGIDFKKLRKKAEDIGIDTSQMTEKEVQRLIFNQGLTTNDNVTDISGRGVGMDVVYNKIKELGGRVTINSEVDKGTTTVIELPLSLLIIPGFLFKLYDETYSIPLEVVERVILAQDSNIEIIDGERYYKDQDDLIYIFNLHGELELDNPKERENLVVLSIVGRKYGFFVEKLIGDKDIVIKKLGETFIDNKDYIGATILSNGNVALILDIVNIIKSAVDEKTRGVE